MAKVAIVIGHTEYRHLNKLECCRDDVAAIKELLDAAGKYDAIEVMENLDAAVLKERIRSFVDKHSEVVEIFFYFTGHGFQHEDEFFFCASDFDAKKPNQTGLSNSELHALLKAANADLIVKVVDACNSGSLLVKANGGFLPINKSGFKNVIQIASCLDSQNSLTGDPLSLFTEKFRNACLQKESGVIYYTDIIDALRDEFLSNNSQTPHFVSQGTGREQFVEDAERLKDLRRKINAITDATPTAAPVETADGQSSLVTMLNTIESKVASQDKVQKFISSFFSKLKQRLSTGEFAEFFDLTVSESANYGEATSEEFIVKVLSKEERRDSFVYAEIYYPQQSQNPFELGRRIGMGDWNQAPEYRLRLNCSLDLVQLNIVLTPRFSTLRQLRLVVSCAPSLELCYVFEIVTQHSLKNWGEYERHGSEVIRRWYKSEWDANFEWVIEKISTKLTEAVKEHLDATNKRFGSKEQ